MPQIINVELPDNAVAWLERERVALFPLAGVRIGRAAVIIRMIHQRQDEERE